MGADGGSVVSRQDIVAQTAPQTEKAVGVACALSGKPLNFDQLVCDYEGKLYIKEHVIEHLLAKSKTVPQIRTLKDIVGLKPHIVNKRWVCPISNKDILDEFYGTKFAAALCGHTLEASLFTQNCPVCDKSATNVIVLNAQGADLARQKRWALDLKKKRIALKKKLNK